MELSGMLHIRTASHADTDTLAQVGKQAFYETFAPHNTESDMQLYLSENFMQEKLRRELYESNAHFYIAEQEGKVAGYVKLRTGKEPASLAGRRQIEIERIYVLNQSQSKKIGKALMAASIELASKKGYEVLWLGVWEHNQKAIQFYRNWGFEIFGSHSFFLGTDHQTDYLMKCEL